MSLLCSRVYTTDTVPLENAWFLLLRFQTSEGTFLPEDEYLVRLKLSNRVGTASRARAEGIHFGKKSERPAIQATAVTVTTAFVKDSQQYVQFLINEILKRVGLTSNIVKGLAAFDPFIRFKRPMDVALKHFEMLYNTFALRSWVPSANESLCRDQYTQLLDHLRTCYGPNFDLTSTSSDLIEFLVGLEFLHDRAHLFHLFELCCLCATSVSPALPDVRFGTVTTGVVRIASPMSFSPAKVILPVFVIPCLSVAMMTTSLAFLSCLPPLGVPLLPRSMTLGHMLTPLAAQRFTSPCRLPAVLRHLFRRRSLSKLILEMPVLSLMIQL